MSGEGLGTRTGRQNQCQTWNLYLYSVAWRNYLSTTSSLFRIFDSLRSTLRITLLTKTQTLDTPGALFARQLYSAIQLDVITPDDWFVNCVERVPPLDFASKGTVPTVSEVALSISSGTPKVIGTLSTTNGLSSSFPDRGKTLTACDADG